MVINQNILSAARAIAANPFKFAQQKAEAKREAYQEQQFEQRLTAPATHECDSSISYDTTQEDFDLACGDRLSPEDELEAAHERFQQTMAEVSAEACKTKSKRTFYCHKLTGPSKDKENGLTGDPVIATVRAANLKEAAQLFHARDAAIKYLD